MRLQSLMPTKRFFILGLNFYVFLVPVISQEADTILSYFTGTTSENQIQLNWAISGGNTCEGTIVQRSLDGNFFETIGEIGGVCGSPDFEIPYFFIDENPLSNKVNFYRLELGSQGYSSAIGIEFIPLNNQRYSLRYDTQDQTAIINFDNQRQNNVRFTLFDIHGRNVLEGLTSGTEIVLPMFNYPSQLFILHLLIDGRELNIKILNH